MLLAVRESSLTLLMFVLPPIQVKKRMIKSILYCFDINYIKKLPLALFISNICCECVSIAIYNMLLEYSLMESCV
ncbi:unnamed protein product [Commensalibacter communis]|nr:unnamed protein product [Commensalibacter communis]CAI3936748.1 unnamed protein product [Commensalibacter communis]